MENNKVIYVRLAEPYNGERDYMFGCISAIYDVLPREVIGYSCPTLYARYTKSGCDYDTGKARIRTLPIYRKKKKN